METVFHDGLLATLLFPCNPHEGLSLLTFDFVVGLEYLRGWNKKLVKGSSVHLLEYLLYVNNLIVYHTETTLHNREFIRPDSRRITLVSLFFSDTEAFACFINFCICLKAVLV